MTDATRAPFRLAIRREGEFVNAYLADAETMKDAMLVASIRFRLVETKEFFDRWKALLTDMFAMAIEDALGVTPESMTEERAPEHERGGHG